MSDFEYADTLAAKMLSEGLRTAAIERRLSIRQIGKLLHYKQAVVLSHMATGRVPIPLDRALDIAAVVGLPPRRFLLSVLEQRHSTVNWSLLTDPASGFATELETLAGRALDELPLATKGVLREVVIDPQPLRRWLSTAELPAIELLRQILPNIRTDGFNSEQKAALRQALKIVG